MTHDLLAFSRRPVAVVRRVAAGLAVVVMFGRVELGLRRRTELPRLCRQLGIHLADGAPTVVPSPPANRDRVARQMRDVDRVARRWPFGDTCLRRCLVLGALLRQLGPTLVIGVRRNEVSAVVAHSWLEFDGRSIDPASVSYAVMR